MASILFKKSYQHNKFKEILFDDLWNKKGIFTTIHVIGKPKKFILLKEHLSKLNNSLKCFSINFQLDYVFFNLIIKKFFKKNIYYDHLFRIAVTNNTISFSLRKRLKMTKQIKGILFPYKRFKWNHKHLKYNKILALSNQIEKCSEEVILTKNKLIYEGGTTNIICIKKNKIHIPKSGYYSGVTLNFFLKYSKRQIIRKQIKKEHLHEYDEILLVGAGKGVVSLWSIPQINWHCRKNTIFNEFQRKYKSYISKKIATK